MASPSTAVGAAGLVAHQLRSFFPKAAMAGADLATLAKPTFVNGHWRKPALSRRKLKVLWKQQASSQVLTPSTASGAAEAATPPLFTARTPMRSLVRPPKGHRADRERAARHESIQKLVARMDKILSDHKKETAAAKEKARPELPF